MWTVLKVFINSLQYCSALCFFVFCFDLQGMWGLSSLWSVSCSVVPDSLQPHGTAAHQAPLSMVFSRQEHWSGVPFPSAEDLPDPGIKLGSPALQADPLPTELWEKPLAPWPGIKPTPSALEGEVSATGPPGKSLASLFGGVFLSRGYLSVRRALNGMLGGLTSGLWCFLPPSLLICPWGWLWSRGPGAGAEIREGPGSFSWCAFSSVFHAPEEQVGQGSIVSCHRRCSQDSCSVDSWIEISWGTLDSTGEDWGLWKCHLAGRSLKSLGDLSSRR